MTGKYLEIIIDCMEEKITIEKLAEMTQSEFRHLETRLDQMVTKDLFKEGFEFLLAEMKAIRSDIADSRMADRIEYSDLIGRVETLEKDVSKLKYSR